MICTDCGQEFDLYLDSSEFDSLNGDPTFFYSDLPYKMCYQCAMRYLDSLFQNVEEDDSEENYDYLY